MSSTGTLMVFAAIILILVNVQCYYLPLTKRVSQGDLNNAMDPKKRPFCNAFTGCGRKRTNLPPLASPREDSVDDESISSLFELNAEPAVEDLSRQIMSEAKLWEAIREANVELARQKQQYAEESAAAEEGTPARSATASCAMPPCII